MVIHQPKFKKNYLRPKCRVDETMEADDALALFRGMILGALAGSACWAIILWAIYA